LTGGLQRTRVVDMGQADDRRDQSDSAKSLTYLTRDGWLGDCHNDARAGESR